MQQANSSATPIGGTSVPPSSFTPPVNTGVATKSTRIPLAVAGIQYNTCKNPACKQYGEHPPLQAKAAVKGPYAIVGGGKGYPLLKCNSCGETPPLKSNQGIVDEIERIGGYLKSQDYYCPNNACENHTIPVGTPKAYRSFGTNAHGSKRVQCCKCKKTFVTTGKPAKGQHDTHLNKSIFNMLVNQVALSRIVKMLDISWTVLYNRIDFIHKQAMLFAGNRERKLKTMPLKRLYMAVDRQEYLVNWTERKDKRNVVLLAIAASDNKTGYVFCNALNFDDSIDRDSVELDAKAIQDSSVAAPYRKYARLWTESSYVESRMRQVKKAAKSNLPGHLIEGINDVYNKTQQRIDVEVFDEKTGTERLPQYGMQIRSEYTMIGLFHHLRSMIGNCEKWRFFLDQEAGIRAAVLQAFAPEIKDHTCEAFYVRIAKEMVQEDKLKLVNDARKKFEDVKELYPELATEEIKLLMLKEEIENMRQLGVYSDSWINAPLPTMSEPEKAVCWLTEHNVDLDENHIAWLYNKASLHSIDNFFMKTRRSIAMCERPMHSSSNNGRTWSAYQAYNPSILKKLLEIYRVYHNYVDVPLRGFKTTPAMRLGLADAVLRFEDILYFE